MLLDKNHELLKTNILIKTKFTLITLFIGLSIKLNIIILELQNKILPERTVYGGFNFEMLRSKTIACIMNIFV